MRTTKYFLALLLISLSTSCATIPHNARLGPTATLYAPGKGITQVYMPRCEKPGPHYFTGIYLRTTQSWWFRCALH